MFTPVPEGQASFDLFPVRSISAQKATPHLSLPLASRSSFCPSHHTLCFVFVATNAPFIVGLAVEIPYIRTSGCGFSQDGLALFR